MNRHKPLPIEQREVTSILVLCNSPFGPQSLDFEINKGEGPHRPSGGAGSRSGDAA